MSIFEGLRKCVNALWQIAMRRCVTGMCYRDVGAVLWGECLLEAIG